MEEIKDLTEALKSVERELNFVKKAYLAYPFIFWAAVLPILYILTLLVGQFSSVSIEFLSFIISILAILWFIIEESRIARKIDEIGKVLGEKREVSKWYLCFQILSWVVAAILAAVFFYSESSWMLAFAGVGLLLMFSVNLAFKKSGDIQMLIAGMIILGAIYLEGKLPLSENAFAIMVISFSFALAGFLYLRKAMRE